MRRAAAIALLALPAPASALGPAEGLAIVALTCAGPPPAAGVAAPRGWIRLGPPHIPDTAKRHLAEAQAARDMAFTRFDDGDRPEEVAAELEFREEIGWYDRYARPAHAFFEGPGGAVLTVLADADEATWTLDCTLVSPAGPGAEEEMAAALTGVPRSDGASDAAWQASGAVWGEDDKLRARREAQVFVGADGAERWSLGWRSQGGS